MFRVRWLGRVPYTEAHALQRVLHDRGRDDHLLLLEHPHVFTLGVHADRGHVLVDPALVGAELVASDRGGDVTYHGPGQLVGYPIFDLAGVGLRRDLHWFLRQLEASLIESLEAFGIPGERRVGYTGVWTGGGSRKIASIGIHVRQWVTWHGFALNVTTDLSPFDLIVPCGIPDVVMTSVAKELAGTGARGHGGTGKDDLMGRVREAVVAAFVHTFGFDGTAPLDLAEPAAKG